MSEKIYPRVLAPTLQPPVFLAGEVVVRIDPTPRFVIVIPSPGEKVRMATPTHLKFGYTKEKESHYDEAIAKNILAELSRDDWPVWPIEGTTFESRLQGVLGPS